MYKSHKICATIEARMTSSRLPGKVLMEFCEKSDLEHIIERLKRSKYLDEVVVATTMNKEDDPIVELCNKIECEYYRGSEEDVLLRVLEAAKSVDSEIIVEITGDCPVIDWRHVDKLIELFFSGEYDYASNAIERTFPRGFDIDIFPVKILEEINVITNSTADHEHVSLYIYTHPEKYRLFNWKADKKLNYPEFEITLDTYEDYQLIKNIYEKLYPINKDFSAIDVVNLLLEDRKITDIVAGINRKDPFKQKEQENNEK